MLHQASKTKFVSVTIRSCSYPSPTSSKSISVLEFIIHGQSHERFDYQQIFELPPCGAGTVLLTLKDFLLKQGLLGQLEIEHSIN
ncbi:uncharacterized protein ARMOST_17248 [Armillaria ostoyae]|uniref:Uncharacterized protein n=1 Tax=Armillaria ostoyae TaxID=47428 RepID=A0A284RYK9_ARMOS|nr:uncharacterized protein ARMOST_17248 [Armillaria ostoyae]